MFLEPYNVEGNENSQFFQLMSVAKLKLSQIEMQMRKLYPMKIDEIFRIAAQKEWRK